MNVTVKDASRLLSVSEKTIYRWLKSGVLPAYKLNGSYRFNSAELLEWAASRRIGVATDALDEADPQVKTLPSLFLALEAGGIHYRLEGNSRDEILAGAVTSLRIPEEINRHELTKSLIAREKLASTALGHGVAASHPRSPGLPFTGRSTVSLFFLEKPVSFAALDGQLTHSLFVIIAANLREHLYLLSKLMFVLRNQQFQNLLDHQASREQLYAGLKEAEARLVEEQDITLKSSQKGDKSKALHA
ncbi:MAG: PTS sugar transporter subunit IIA [Desulfuromonadaceae bacterium]|nr:PTS sugar transporter subunit IIA [Desulfuromonadaceae bacterium]